MWEPMYITKCRRLRTLKLAIKEGSKTLNSNIQTERGREGGRGGREGGGREGGGRGPESVLPAQPSSACQY